MAAFEDTFTVGVDTLLTAHTPDVGTSWTLEIGDNTALLIYASTGKLGNTSSTLTFVSSDDLGDADCYVEAELTDFGTFQANMGIYCALRVQDADNFIGWYLGGTGGAGMRLVRSVGGVLTNLLTMQGVVGNVYRIEAEGSTLRFYENSIQQGSDITESSFQTETKQGIIADGAATFQRFITTYNADTLGGGGGVTVTVDSGTYLYTGSDVNLVRAKIIKALPGFYNYTGNDVSLLKGYRLTANTGSYDYLGQDVNLTYTPAGQFVLTAESGNYSYVGADINFSRDRVIIMSSGTYNYNGTDIQIILPGQIWTDKPNVSTNWNNQTNVTTIWTDK